MKTYYFCNPTKHRHRAQELRLRIEKETGLVLVSPFYDKNGVPTEEIRQMDNGEETTVDKYQIVDRDLELIDNADGLIAYITNKSSWGSIQECFYASRVLRKPTYIIFDAEFQGSCTHCGTYNPNSPNHPWVLRNSTKTFGTLEGFIAFAKEKLCSPQAA